MEFKIHLSLVDTPEQTRRLYVLLRKMLLQAFISSNGTSLSDYNKLTYDILEHSYTSSLEMGPYLLYEEPLTPLTGTQAQLPILLSEYRFYNTDDIDTYLVTY